MGDEIGDVGPLGQMAGKGRRRIEHDDDGAAAQAAATTAGRDLADHRVRHGEDHHLGTVDGGLCGHAVDADGLLQPAPGPLR